MGSNLSKLINSCISRDSECSSDCGYLKCYCCEYEGGSLNIQSHISEDEDEEEEPTPIKRHSNIRNRRSSE